MQRNRGEERARAAAEGLKVKLRRCRAAEGASGELGDEKHCPFVATDNTFHSSCLYVGVCSACLCVCVCVCMCVCLQALCELLIPLIAAWRPAGEPPRTEIKSTLLRYKL